MGGIRQRTAYGQVAHLGGNILPHKHGGLRRSALPHGVTCHYLIFVRDSLAGRQLIHIACRLPGEHPCQILDFDIVAVYLHTGDSRQRAAAKKGGGVCPCKGGGIGAVRSRGDGEARHMRRSIFGSGAVRYVKAGNLSVVAG